MPSERTFPLYSIENLVPAPDKSAGLPIWTHAVSGHWSDYAHGHDRHHGDHNNHEHDGGNGDMVPMTISVTRVKALGSTIVPVGMPGPAGTGNMWAVSETVHAVMDVHVRGLNARARIDMSFEAPAESDRADWAEIAYERALMMLDPA